MRGIRFLLLFAACVAGVFAQTSSPTTRLDVVVTDSAGKPVTNLTRDSFLVSEGGETRTIRSFTPVDAPWNIVLLFDQGLAWLQSPDWQLMGRSISAFLARLAPSDRVAIAAFENKVVTLMDWRNAKTGQDQSVTFRPIVQGSDGTKDLHGAITWAIEKLRGAEGRKAVILLTDGRDGRLAPQWLMNSDRQEVFDPLFGEIDTTEADEFLKVQERVQTSGARLFFLAVNTNRSPEFRGRPISGLYPGAKEAVSNYIARVRLRMQRLAEVSEGSVLFGEAPEHALAVYGRLYESLFLGARYTLEYSSAPNSDDVRLPLEIRLREQGLKAHFIRATR
jgi:VWFA-related protein